MPRHLFVFCTIFFLTPAVCAANALSLDHIDLPEGFSISVFAEVPKARSLALSPAGIVYVGSRSGDQVWAVADRDGDGRAEERHVVAEGLEIGRAHV